MTAPFERFVATEAAVEEEGVHVHRGAVVVDGPLDGEGCRLCSKPDPAVLDAFAERSRRVLERQDVGPSFYRRNPDYQGEPIIAADGSLRPHAHVPDSMAMGDCMRCGHVLDDTIHDENAVLLWRLDRWQEGNSDTGPLIRWAATHLRGCIKLGREQGQSLVEYSLIAVLVVIVVIVALTFLGGNVLGLLTDIGSKV